MGKYESVEGKDTANARRVTNTLSKVISLIGLKYRFGDR